MNSSTSNAAMQGAPASFRTQSHYGSGTANTVTSKQVFASLPRFSRNSVEWFTASNGTRQMRSARRNPSNIIRRFTKETKADFQVNGTSRWGQHMGGGCINGASVLHGPRTTRSINRTNAQFGMSDIAPNRGEVGLPVRTALGGGAGQLGKGLPQPLENVPSVFDVSQDLPDKWRKLDAKARNDPNFVEPRPDAQDTSARVTGMESLIHSQIQGKPSTSGLAMIERNPQMQTFLGVTELEDGTLVNTNSQGAQLARWSSRYNGLNNVRGQPPYQHQMNPIVMRDINADFYSQLF